MKQLLHVWVIPNSKKTGIDGRRATGELIVRLKSPPTEGKANQLLIEFLSETLNIPKSSISIKKGEKSRQKTLEISASFSLDL